MEINSLINHAVAGYSTLKATLCSGISSFEIIMRIWWRDLQREGFAVFFHVIIHDNQAVEWWRAV